MWSAAVVLAAAAAPLFPLYGLQGLVEALADPRSAVHSDAVDALRQSADCSVCAASWGGDGALPEGSACGDCIRDPFVARAPNSSSPPYTDGQFELSPRCGTCLEQLLDSDPPAPSRLSPHLFSSSMDVRLTFSAVCAGWPPHHETGWGCCPLGHPGCETNVSAMYMLPPGIPASKLIPAIYQYDTDADCMRECVKMSERYGPICCYAARETYRARLGSFDEVFNKGCFFARDAQADNGPRNAPFRRAVSCDTLPLGAEFDDAGRVVRVDGGGSAHRDGLRVGMRIRGIDGESLPHRPGVGRISDSIAHARTKRGEVTLTVDSSVCAACFPGSLPTLRTLAHSLLKRAGRWRGCASCGAPLLELLLGDQEVSPESDTSWCRRCVEDGGPKIICGLCRRSLTEWRVPAACPVCASEVPAVWAPRVPCEQLLPLPAQCSECISSPVDGCDDCTRQPSDPGDGTSTCGRCWRGLASGGPCTACASAAPSGRAVVDCARRLPLSDECAQCVAAVPDSSPDCLDCTNGGSAGACQRCWHHIPASSPSCRLCSTELLVALMPVRVRRLSSLGTLSIRCGCGALWLCSLVFIRAIVVSPLDVARLPVAISFVATTISAIAYLAMTCDVGADAQWAGGGGRQFWAVRCIDWMLTLPLVLRLVWLLADRRGGGSLLYACAAGLTATTLWLVGGLLGASQSVQLPFGGVTVRYLCYSIAVALLLHLTLLVVSVQDAGGHAHLSNGLLALCMLLHPVAWAAAEWWPEQFSADAEAVAYASLAVASKGLLGIVSLLAGGDDTGFGPTDPSETEIKVVNYAGGSHIGWSRDAVTHQILRVMPGMPAAEAGITPGMVILEIDGRKVKTDDDITQALAAADKSAAGRFVLKVWRGRRLASGSAGVTARVMSGVPMVGAESFSRQQPLYRSASTPLRRSSTPARAARDSPPRKDPVPPPPGW